MACWFGSVFLENTKPKILAWYPLFCKVWFGSVDGHPLMLLMKLSWFLHERVYVWHFVFDEIKLISTWGSILYIMLMCSSTIYLVILCTSCFNSAQHQNFQTIKQELMVVWQKCESFHSHSNRLQYYLKGSFLHTWQ